MFVQSYFPVRFMLKAYHFEWVASLHSQSVASIVKITDFECSFCTFFPSFSNAISLAFLGVKSSSFIYRSTIETLAMKVFFWP
jgi:hypothetical protein